MKKYIAIGICMLTCFSIGACGKTDKNEYDYLAKPRIVKMQKKVKMLILETKGDTIEIGGLAFAKLYKAHALLNRKRIKMDQLGFIRSPELFSEKSRNEKITIWALPLPEHIDKIPDNAEFKDIRIDYWNYGDVAEILLKGPYDRESAEEKILRTFINENGYEIIGPNEQVILRGPDSGDLKSFIILIRYEVRKKEKANK